MSYQGLARKWRPKAFSEVVGQEPVVATLNRALDADRVSHALLFTGSRGVGKTTLARLMAKAISCETGITSSPCGQCQHCKEITAGTSIDIVEIDGASHTGVDNVRELRDSARYQPQAARRKIFIIDEVHMLSTGAFNALLKILEEPPPHVQFIFATTEPHKIPITILSRCQRYDFKRIRTHVIVSRLQDILKRENISIESSGLEAIARAADGGMRDALSLTDQVLSFAGDQATEADVIDALGLIDRKTILDATFAILDRDHRGALKLVTSAYERGHALRELMQLVTEELRNLTVSKILGTVSDFADLTEDDCAMIDERAQSADAKDLQRLFQQSLEGIDVVSKAADPRLAIELIFIRLCDRPPLGEAVAISEALVRLDALARRKPVPPLTGATPTKNGDRQKIVSSAFDSQSEQSSAQGSTQFVEEEKKKPEGQRAPPKRDDLTATAPPPMEEPEDTAALKGAEKTIESVDSTNEYSSELESLESDFDEEDIVELADRFHLENVDERWVETVRLISLTAKRIGGHLTHGHFLGLKAAADKTFLQIGFKKEIHKVSMEEEAKRRIIPEMLQAFGDKVELQFVMVEDAEGLSPSIADAKRTAVQQYSAALKTHANQHPVVQKALSQLGAQVLDVKYEK